MVASTYNTVCDVFCKHCGACYALNFNSSDMYDWLSGTLPIQDALYYLSQNERELLLSGTCGDCFDKIFALDNDE